MQNRWKHTRHLPLTSLWELLSSSYWDSSLASWYWPAGGGSVLSRAAAVSGGVSKIETRWGWRHTTCTWLPRQLHGGFSAATSLWLCRWVWVICTCTVNNLCCCAILHGMVHALIPVFQPCFTHRFYFYTEFFPRSRFNKFHEFAWLIGISLFYHFSSIPGCYFMA